MYNISDFDYISSKENEKVKLFSKLDKSKYRNENKLFLAEGVKLTVEAIETGCAKYILVREDVFCRDDIVRILKLSEYKTKVFVLSEGAFSKVTTESAPQGVIAVCRYPDIHTLADENMVVSAGKKIIVLDGVRDPGNLGTMLRTAVAFGIDAVILGDCADVYNPKTVRAAMGAVFKLELFVCDILSSVIEAMKENGRRVFGAALGENTHVLGECVLRATDAVVIGNEGHGISPEVLSVCDGFIKIPMEENCESLNAAIAASVIMWELYKL